jgi:hypothetical protein
MTIRRYSRYTYYLIAAFVIFIALLWTAAAVQAQVETPVPTVEADVTTEPTPEPTANPTEAPLPPDDQAYIDTITRLAELIESLTAGDGSQQLAAMLAAAPGWMSVGILIGVGIAYVITRITKTKADDAIFDRVFGPILTLLTGTVTSLAQLVRQITPPAVGTTTITTTVAAESADEVTPPDKSVDPVG